MVGAFVLLIGNLVNQVTIGNSTLDIQLHDTYFVIAHVHLMLYFALLFLAFSAVYFVFPRITGRMMNAPMGYIHFTLTLVSVYLLCWPVPYEGLAGMPRWYMDYSTWVSLDGFSGTNVFVARVMMVLLGAQVVFVVNLVYSAVRGRKSSTRFE